MLGFDFWAQLVIVLVALFYGARKGGMALGPVSYTHLTLPTNSRV